MTTIRKGTKGHWTWPKSDNASKFTTRGPFLFDVQQKPCWPGGNHKSSTNNNYSQSNSQQPTANNQQATSKAKHNSNWQMSKVQSTGLSFLPCAAGSFLVFCPKTHLTNVIVHLVLDRNRNHWMLLIQWFHIVIRTSRCDLICIFPLSRVQRLRRGCRIASRSV